MPNGDAALVHARLPPVALSICGHIGAASGVRPFMGKMPFVDGESEEDALDAYSRVVTQVAERLTPSVASLNVWHRDRRGRDLMGAGSGVAISADGFVVTSAHVVVGASRGSASFVDGHETRFEVVGRDALSDLAVLRTDDDAARAAELGDASRLRLNA